MKNRYGGPLRALVAESFHVDCVIDMTGAAAFHTDVIAYPAITVQSRQPGPATRVLARPQIDADSLSRLAARLTNPSPAGGEEDVKEVHGLAKSEGPWLLTGCDRVNLARRLEERFPLIEEAGCRVGIGVATGADKVFIGRFDELDVEDDRKLPLATTRDLAGGSVQWRGLGIVNPFADDGGLVDLAAHPRLQRIFERHADTLKRRHVAKKSPRRWYRTIDRIHAELATTPKLLIPDIKGQASIVHESGRLYPHHNLYYITATSCDLAALQGVLCSGIAALFVSLYSTRMRGGYLPFQAQYLRRIRLPVWDDVGLDDRAALSAAAKRLDWDACAETTGRILDLTPAETTVLDELRKGDV